MISGRLTCPSGAGSGEKIRFARVTEFCILFRTAVVFRLTALTDGLAGTRHAPPNLT